MKYKIVNEKGSMLPKPRVYKKTSVIIHHVSEQLLFLCSKDDR